MVERIKSSFLYALFIYLNSWLPNSVDSWKIFHASTIISWKKIHLKLYYDWKHGKYFLVFPCCVYMIQNYGINPNSNQIRICGSWIRSDRFWDTIIIHIGHSKLTVIGLCVLSNSMVPKHTPKAWGNPRLKLFKVISLPIAKWRPQPSDRHWMLLSSCINMFWTSPLGTTSPR